MLLLGVSDVQVYVSTMSSQSVRVFMSHQAFMWLVIAVAIVALTIDLFFNGTKGNQK